MSLFGLLEQAAVRFPRQPAVCVGARVGPPRQVISR